MASELVYRGHDAQPLENGDRYTPEPEKRLVWLSRTVRYFLREQRPLFVLLGMVLAALFFSFFPRGPPSGALHLATADPKGWRPTEPRHLASHGGHSYHRFAIDTAGRGFVGGKVPLGLKRKGLRIVVTGGAGFVGSHLVDRLIARGDSVIVVDNFFTGRKENVMHHFGNPNFELIRHDVVEPILLEVDQIYHLACPASPVHYKFNPVKTIKTNVVGTLNMLGLAKRVGARFLLTSTSEVYGDPLQHPQVETYWGNVNPIGVRSCYDEGKRTAETLTMDYHRGAQVEVRIARIFNTYGPRMCIDDGRVVSNFVAQALRKEPLTVYGDGKQTRSFQYVSDLVEGLMRLMEGEHIGPFNLGNPGEFTMLELANVVQETIDSNAKIEFRRGQPFLVSEERNRTVEAVEMVAEVSSLARMVDGYKEEGEGKSELVTLDLLGGCCGDGGAATTAEVNLEFQIRTAGEMRLAPSSAKLCDQQTKPSPASPHLHDLSLSPPWLSAASVGRKPPPAATAVAYHSVCTLEKVKSALERESRLAADARVPVVHLGSASPPSSSRSSLSSAPTTTITTNSSSAKRRHNEPDESNGEPAMAVVACPECLLYVLICKVEPRCPRCAAHVPVNGTNKKPRRIDLNFSFQTGSNE